jgi:hypothetical protein
MGSYFLLSFSLSLSSESVLITTPAASNTRRFLGEPWLLPLLGGEALGMIPPAAGLPWLVSLLRYSSSSIRLMIVCYSISLSMRSLSCFISSLNSFLFFNSASSSSWNNFTLLGAFGFYTDGVVFVTSPFSSRIL